MTKTTMLRVGYLLLSLVVLIFIFLAPLPKASPYIAGTFILSYKDVFTDGECIYTINNDHELRDVDPDTLRETHIAGIPAEYYVTSPSGVYYMKHNEVRMISLPDGKTHTLFTFPGNSDYVLSHVTDNYLVFSLNQKDERGLYTLGSYYSLLIDSGEIQHLLDFNAEEENQIGFRRILCHEGDELYVSGNIYKNGGTQRDEVIERWDLTTGDITELARFPGSECGEIIDTCILGNCLYYYNHSTGINKLLLTGTNEPMPLNITVDQMSFSRMVPYGDDQLLIEFYHPVYSDETHSIIYDRYFYLYDSTSRTLTPALEQPQVPHAGITILGNRYYLNTENGLVMGDIEQ